MLATILLAATVLQVNPCTSPPPPGVTFNPTRIVFSSPDHALFEADGTTPKVSEYQLGFFAQSDKALTAPVVPLQTIPKASVTQVASGCYQIAVTPPAGAQVLVSAVKSRNALTGGESVWTLSNPFGSAPLVLSPLGPVIILR